MVSASGHSYAQILKSSSLMAGVQGVNLLLGMVRAKFSAILIGTAGAGLLGNYGAIVGLVGTIAGLGIQSSGVRGVAEAAGHGDQQAIARAILALRRVCWLTGLLGALAAVVLAVPFSRWTFGTEGQAVLFAVRIDSWAFDVDSHALDIALLGLVILFGNLSGGQLASIQGLRRVGDLALLQVIGAVVGTAISIGCYAGLGLQGVVPSLLLASAANLATSWYFARRVPLPNVNMGWRESLRMAGGMVRLGLTLMWSGLAAGFVTYLIRALITQQVGLDAAGIFGAAFSLSGMFVGVVLNAMGADYYPRLTAAAPDRAAMNRLVNEQTEIGLLLAVPGLLATLTLAPWIIRIFYTDAFLPAVELLQWFVLGCLGRVISWPPGYVMLALGKGRWFFATDTLWNLLHITLVWIGLLNWGLAGASIAFFAFYVVVTMTVYWVAHRLTGFRWSAGSRRLLLLFLPIVALAFLAARGLPLWPATAFGVAVSLAASVLCLRGLAQRVGPEHRAVRMACKVPGMRRACGL